MMSAHADIAMRSRDYGGEESSKAKDIPDATESLHITNPTVEPIPQMLKASTKCTTINPNARAAQNYFVVEYLAQSPCAMSALEVHLVRLSAVLCSLSLGLLIQKILF